MRDQHEEGVLMKTTTEQNKRLALAAFDRLFNQRDYAKAERYWSPNYIQHSAHIAPGGEGLFNLVKTLPLTLKYEPGTVVAEGDFVIIRGRYSGAQQRNWIVADILRIKDGIFVKHWDVIQGRSDQGGIEKWSARVRPQVHDIASRYSRPKFHVASESVSVLQTKEFRYAHD